MSRILVRQLFSRPEHVETLKAGSWRRVVASQREVHHEQGAGGCFNALASTLVGNGADLDASNTQLTRHNICLPLICKCAVETKVYHRSKVLQNSTQCRSRGRRLTFFSLFLYKRAYTRHTIRKIVV